MIDTHRTGIGEHVMHHIAVHPETGLFKGDRIKRRLAPVLTLLVEHVRRSANRGTLGESLGIPPHVRTGGMHANGHIRDDADLHTGLAGGLLLRGRQWGFHRRGYCRLLLPRPNGTRGLYYSALRLR